MKVYLTLLVDAGRILPPRRQWRLGSGESRPRSKASGFARIIMPILRRFVVNFAVFKATTTHLAVGFASMAGITIGV